MDAAPGDRRGPADDGATVAALLAAVRAVAAELRDGRRPPDVHLGSRLDADLGLDSLSVAELLVRIEEVLHVRLPEETLATVSTPGDLLEVLGASGDAGALADSAAPVAAPTRRVASTPPHASRPPPRTSFRETLYGAYVLTVFVLVGAVVLPAVVVLPTVRLRWQLVRAAARLLLRLGGVRLEVVGHDHLRRGGPHVLVANHVSHVDPLVLGAIVTGPVVFAAVRDLAGNPVVRTFLRRMDAYLVDRDDRARGVAAVDALTQAVRDGRDVAFFPEGRRTPVAGLEPFRMGAFVVAANAGVPVLPVTVRGTRAVLPVGRWLPRRGPVQVTISPPVTTTGSGWEGAVALRRGARSAILAHCDEPDLT